MCSTVTGVDQQIALPTWYNRPMKISVNFDSCQSNALCMAAAPDIFEVRDDGYLYILVEEPDESRRAAVMEAARLCPTQAITVS